MPNDLHLFGWIIVVSGTFHEPEMVRVRPEPANVMPCLLWSWHTGGQSDASALPRVLFSFFLFLHLHCSTFVSRSRARGEQVVENYNSSFTDSRHTGISRVFSNGPPTLFGTINCQARPPALLPELQSFLPRLPALPRTEPYRRHSPVSQTPRASPGFES